MNIDSRKITVESDQKTCYEFLSQPESYKDLMPESIKKFELNNKGGFLFQLQGMPVISLKLEEKTPHDKVVWGSANDNFKFQLWTEITELSSDQTEIQLRFHGDFNPMITMMAKKPLEKFIETLTSNLGTARFQ